MTSNGEREPVAVCAASLTDTGRVRDHNEDYVSCRVPEQAAREAAYGSLFLVCDGVGGGVSGEVASQHAGERIVDEYYGGLAAQTPSDRLVNAIWQANSQIFQENRDQPEGRRMTTTVVAAVVLGQRLFLAHTGDSRAYLITGNQITQVTRDHSWVAEMVRSGDLTPAEAESHPWRNRITRALGMGESADIERKSLDLALGDTVLLCSDGLTRHVGAAEILEVVTHHAPSEATRRLVDMANERGGQDNISVIIAGLLPPGTACNGKLDNNSES